VNRGILSCGCHVESYIAVVCEFCYRMLDSKNNATVSYFFKYHITSCD
jgi:hypothetical protein